MIGLMCENKYLTYYFNLKVIIIGNNYFEFQVTIIQQVTLERGLFYLVLWALVITYEMKINKSIF